MSADSFHSLMREIMEFVKDRDWMRYHTPKNLASALSVEAGELLEIFMWSDPTFEDIKEDSSLRRRVEEEMADVLIYLLEMFCLLGSDISGVVRRKMDLNARKYPVALARGKSDKYNMLWDSQKVEGGGGG